MSTAGSDLIPLGTDVYFSADVETDGPIPGPYSMLAIGICFAGTYDGTTFRPAASPQPGFYREIRPISDRFDAETLGVSGLDRERLVREGDTPQVAMRDAAAWIRARSGQGTPVLVAQPVAFDWTWLYWYFCAFASAENPFGHSSCYDVKTAFAVKSGNPLSRAGRSAMPDHLKPARSHRHEALQDARDQADMFINVFRWQHHEQAVP